MKNRIEKFDILRNWYKNKTYKNISCMYYFFYFFHGEKIKNPNPKRFYTQIGGPVKK